MKKIVFVMMLAAMLLALPAMAQDDAVPERTELTAPDGLVLVGDWVAPAEPPEDGVPAVLLMHMLRSQRSAYDPLVPVLVEAGYAVINVDMRGHGETGGAMDWPLAEQDVQLWIDWLSEQPGVDPERINIVGASIGSNLALRGMANDEAVVTAIALSPGLDYHGVTTEDALATIAFRPVYLVAGHMDAYSADSVRTLAMLAEGDIQMRVFLSGSHGTSLFSSEESLVPSIVQWLDWQNVK